VILNKQKLDYAEMKEVIFNKEKLEFAESKKVIMKETGLCRDERSDT
jgi:hypothetical protein